jgi:lipid II:glycine glycyltransferase (peptidoglycan interpeptide bridge formation enzyme)
MNWEPLQAETEPAFDAMAGAAPESGFMQSGTWAAFKRLEGFEVLRLGLFEGSDLLGGASLMRLPATEPQFILCPEGPVLPWAEPAKARAALKSLTEYVRAHCGEEVLGLRIEPHLEPPRPSMLRNWSKAPVDLTPLHTPFLDLRLSEEAFLAQMSPKGRYNLRLSGRHGVEVVRTREVASLKTFYILFEETSRRNDFFAEPIGFFLNLASSLFPSGMAQIYLAKHEGEVLAGILVVFFGRRATYLYGASSIERREVMPNYPLHWEAMRDARERGCVEYDLYGYDPFDRPGHLYAGITRFKKQWGGMRRDRIGGMDCLFYDRLADHVAARLATQD